MNTLPFHISYFHDRPGQLTAIKYKIGGSWLSLSWTEYQAQIQAMFALYRHLGVGKGDHVVIYSPSRFEWAVCDLAALCLGIVIVPIYSNAAKEDVDLILGEVKPKLLLIGEQDQLDRLPAEAMDIPIITFENIKGRGQKTFETLNAELNKLANQESNSKDFIEQCRNVRLEDVATVVYTSGTSGTPKGVVLTHRQIMSEVSDIMNAFPISAADTTLSFLPYAHILGRVEMWLSAYAGFTLAFAESIEKLRLNLLDVQPTVLIAVPRIFEKVHAAVLNKLNSSKLAQTIKKLEAQGLAGSIASAPFRILLKSALEKKLKESLGGRMKYAISGGAPLPRAISEFFRDHGVLLLEGYGLTETTGAICVNTPDHHHFGTAGKPLPEVKIHLAQDGEVWIKSDKVAVRYFNPDHGQPLNDQGFFPTGDIGEFTQDGFLKITDRKKDLIKTSGGKYVAPQRLESLLKRNPLISQVLVHGDQRKFIVVLITLDAAELKSWALRNQIPFSRVQDLYHAQKVEAEVERIIKDVNAELSSFETIKKFYVLEKDFSVADGELTPSLKVKRRFVEAKYKNVLDQLYGM